MTGQLSKSQHEIKSPEPWPKLDSPNHQIVRTRGESRALSRDTAKCQVRGAPCSYILGAKEEMSKDIYMSSYMETNSTEA